MPRLVQVLEVQLAARPRLAAPELGEEVTHHVPHHWRQPAGARGKEKVKVVKETAGGCTQHIPVQLALLANRLGQFLAECRLSYLYDVTSSAALCS